MSILPGQWGEAGKRGVREGKREGKEETQVEERRLLVRKEW